VNTLTEIAPHAGDVVIIPAADRDATKAWRRLIRHVDPSREGAFALTGQGLDPGAAYRIRHGAVIVSVDTTATIRRIRLLTVTTRGLEVAREWTQKSPLGARVVKAVAKALPASPVQYAGAVAGVVNRWDGYCYRCRQDVPSGAGNVVRIGDKSRVTHRDQCPPVPARPNAYATSCSACGRWVPAEAGVVVGVDESLAATTEWLATGRVRWVIEHVPGGCATATPYGPNRYTDWCPCGRLVYAGQGEWADGVARHATGCQAPPPLPMWRTARRDQPFAVGEVLRTTVSPRPGERDVPAESPGCMVVDETVTSLIATVVDARTREDDLHTALVRAATWEEASAILVDEVELAVDAQPGTLFRGHWSAERIGPSAIRSNWRAQSRSGGANPWLCELTGYEAPGRYRRTFLRGRRDYGNANNRGTRGVDYLWVLQQARVYQAYWPTSWTAGTRAFLRVTAGGDVEQVTRAQVDAHLAYAAEWAGTGTVEP
jgi:hypothetical protein